MVSLDKGSEKRRREEFRRKNGSSCISGENVEFKESEIKKDIR